MVKILCVGKIKEDFIVKGIDEYKKRLQAFTKFEVKEVSEVNSLDIKSNIDKEGLLLLEQIKNDEFVITLEIKGELLSSEELASLIDSHLTYGDSNITFVIGGSNGLSSDVVKRSNFHFSFGRVTYPHQLMRLILTEQIYRAFTIINNQKYHK